MDLERDKEVQGRHIKKERTQRSVKGVREDENQKKRANS